MKDLSRIAERRARHARRESLAKLAVSPRCPDCRRTFDLTDANDAQEWAYGHDCETPIIFRDPETGTSLEFAR